MDSCLEMVMAWLSPRVSTLRPLLDSRYRRRTAMSTNDSEPSRISSKIRAAGRPRKRNDIANVGHAGGELNRALQAQTEARMRHGAVTPQVQVPPVGRGVQRHFL